MTNKERWLLYTEGLSSPQNFIDWTWRFVISSALERRVWFGANHMQLFPNMYIILVGRAGVGKGIAIHPALELLKFHKRKDFTTATEQTTDNERLLIQKIDQANLQDSEATQTKVSRGGEKVDPPLFPCAPDATTYEALVEAMSKSGRRIQYINDEKQLKIYYHCSMYFGLPELGSLFRKHTQDTVNYLLGLYDCPLDYEYKTKTKGEDRVRRGCLNILAGTTPEFMEQIFDQRLIEQGFSSRTMFIFGVKNRKHVFVPPSLSEEQLKAREELLIHIKNLARLYGQARVEPSTMEFLHKWWAEYQEDKANKASVISPKLEHYDSRKNIHVIKVAMANHFGESTDLLIPQYRFEEAIADLKEEEKSMHIALSFESDNPLAKCTDKVYDMIKAKGEVDMVDMLTALWKQLPNGKSSLEEILQYLIGTDRIKEVEVPDKYTNKTKLMYKII